MPSEADQVEIRLTPHELASTVEALHDAILRRLSWSVLEEFKGWRNLDLKVVQTVINTEVSAYGKCMMDFDAGKFEKDPMYREQFSIPGEAWDWITAITLAEEWSDVPFHPEDDCPMCGKFAR
jgi:hypothetical protein